METIYTSIKEFDLEKDKKLYDKVVAYDELKEQENDIKDTLDKIRKEIIGDMKEKNIEKAKSQLYSVNLAHIEQKRLAEKKLIELLEARGLMKLYESCLYDSNYDRLTVKKRKGGGNIF